MPKTRHASVVLWIASLLSYSDLYQQTRSLSLPKQTILGPQRAKEIGPHQLDVSQLLGQRVRVAADRHDVALYRLGLGLQDGEPVCGCGAEFRQDFLVLAEGGEFSDETLHHLLDVLSVRLLGSKGSMTPLTARPLPTSDAPPSNALSSTGFEETHTQQSVQKPGFIGLFS